MSEIKRKVAILGRQNPLCFREWMRDRLIEAGYDATIRDMETRTFLDFAHEFDDHDAIITCGEKIPTEAMKMLGEGRVRMLSRWGSGTDEMDRAEASKQGIAICNAAGALSVAVAECAIGLMINLLREFPARDAAVRNNDWSHFFDGRLSHQLEGKTVGLIGFGDIAKALAKMLYGFDCNIIASDIVWDEETARKYGVKRVDTETIRREADVISLHLPAIPSTVNMINKEFLSGMKPTAILINTGRGSLVVEEDLAWALENGVIAAAGLDVFRQEPPDPDNPLLKLKNTMLLPHAGAGAMECLVKSSAMAVSNIIDYFDGKPLKNLVNKDCDVSVRGFEKIPAK